MGREPALLGDAFLCLMRSECSWDSGGDATGRKSGCIRSLRSWEFQKYVKRQRKVI